MQSIHSQTLLIEAQHSSLGGVYPSMAGRSILIFAGPIYAQHPTQSFTHHSILIISTLNSALPASRCTAWQVRAPLSYRDLSRQSIQSWSKHCI